MSKQSKQAKSAKKPYRAPVVRDFGDVRELTRGPGPGTLDGTFGFDPNPGS